MKIFDSHSHWSTRKGAIFRTPAEQETQRKIWGTDFAFETEDEMAETFRRNHARVILDIATTILHPHSIDEIRALHDYTFEQQRRHPDVIFGHWLSLDPRLGKQAVAEFERCISQNAGFIGFAIVGQTRDGVPASDPVWDPFYKLPSMRACRS